MVKRSADAADHLDDAARAQGLKEDAPRLWHRYRRLPKNVVVIGLISLLNDASSEIIYPLLPLFLTLTLGASPKIIGLIEGTAESLSSLLKLFAGYFSDRRGRRKGWVVGGYALANFIRPLLGFATNWLQVLAIRLTDRVGKGVRTAPRDAMIADTVSVKERGLAFGFHRAMDHAGAVIGPLVGFLLIYWIASDRNSPSASDYRKIFLLASVPALCAVAVAVFGLKETVTKRGADALARPRLSLRGFDANFKRFLFLVALFTLSNSSDAFLLLRAKQAGVLEVNIPLLWAALHVTKVLSSLVGGDLSDRLGRRTLIASGWLLYAAVYLDFAFISTPAAAWTVFLIYGVYFGLAEGAEKALVADLVRANQRGTAYGLYNLAFGITVLPASLMMGFLWDWFSPQAAFIVSACVGATAALLLLLTVSAKGQLYETDTKRVSKG
ncbi:MAG: MFS transporter [Acidobacteriota bacterium]|nr:MFS transporter [Acidobacteriota bacterium]